MKLVLRTAAVLLVMASASLSHAEPRYRFEVGEELTYELTARERMLPEPESVEPLDLIRVRVTPVRRNEDGTWRLLFRTTVRLYSQGENAADEPRVRFENESLGYCDLAPDGGYADNATLLDTLLFGTVPEFVLPPLPREGEDGDGRLAAALDWTYRLRVESEEGDRATIVGDIQAPLDARYDNRREVTITFDTAQGRPLRLVRNSTGGDPGERFHNRQTVELVGVTEITPEEVAAYEAAAERFIEAQTAWWRASEEAYYTRSVAACRAMLEASRDRIIAAREAETYAPVDSLYSALLAMQQRAAESAIESAEQRAELYDRPPVDWVAEKLGGGGLARADLAGNPVLLDFWYRGCSHCVAATPKIKRLRERFADDGLVVLGVNNDRDVEDALHVIEAFDLPYDNVRNVLPEPVTLSAVDGDEPITRVSEVYAVVAWPTFIVLDGEGRVAEFVEGNGDEAEATLAAAIERCLKAGE